jgi:hypothetical protein
MKGTTIYSRPRAEFTTNTGVSFDNPEPGPAMLSIAAIEIAYFEESEGSQEVHDPRAG